MGATRNEDPSRPSWAMHAVLISGDGFYINNELNPRRWQPSAKFDKKTAVHQQNKLGSKDINYLSFFLNKQRTDFLEIVKKVKENKFGLDKIVARLPYYSTFGFAMLYFACFGVAKITPLQIVLTGSLYYFISLYHLYTNYTLCFHIVPLLLILIISSL